jgi:hypothetical protein
VKEEEEEEEGVELVVEAVSEAVALRFKDLGAVVVNISQGDDTGRELSFL